MSKRFKWNVAPQTTITYVPPATFEEELWEEPNTPGNSALVIGDPYATAYVVEGTPAELRKWSVVLASRIPGSAGYGGDPTVTITEAQLTQVILGTTLTGRDIDGNEEIPGLAARVAHMLFGMLTELPVPEPDAEPGEPEDAH
jgi:hypothetical protein